jgi:hypothetical protein
MIYVHHVPQLDAAARLSTAQELAAGPAPTVADLSRLRVETRS